MDGRRRRWVALDVSFTANALGSRLRGRFGNEGLLVWIAVMAAAKRSANEGTVTFASEGDLWSQLGIDPPAFTPEEFLAVTGTLKETSRRRRGDLTDITLSRWGDLQEATSRAIGTQRKARSRGGITRDIGGTDQTRQDQTRQDPPTPYSEGKPAGLLIAIEEARGDPAVRSPVAVGRHRYSENSAFYDEEARRRVETEREAKRQADCSVCDAAGLRWRTATGVLVAPDDMDSEFAERCDHALMEGRVHDDVEAEVSA